MWGLQLTSLWDLLFTQTCFLWLPRMSQTFSNTVDNPLYWQFNQFYVHSSLEVLNCQSSNIVYDKMSRTLTSRTLVAIIYIFQLHYHDNENMQKHSGFDLNANRQRFSVHRFPRRIQNLNNA